MSEIKTRPNRKSVTKFIEAVENETRREDAKVLLEIFSRVTGRKPVMWGDSIIGFGSFEYSTSKDTYDWMITGYSPRKQNLALYIMQGFDRFKDDLEQIGKVKTTRSCLYINRLSKIDTAALERFLVKVVTDMETRYKCK